MKLSIIIPIYNGAQFLEKLIETILAFTITDFECIFIDNNSTDDSFILLKKLLETSSIEYSILTEEKKGAGHARNTGIRNARGQYLAFLDCDDSIVPEKFEYDFNIFNKYEVDFVFCRAKRFYENGRTLNHPITDFTIGLNNPPTLGIAWLKNFFLLQGTGSLMVKKEVVESLGGFHSSKTSEDAFLFIRMALIYKGYFYNKTFFHYMRHSDSTISISNKESGSLRRYFELRQNLFNDEIVRKNLVAKQILKNQLQTDILKLHRLGADLKVLKNENLKSLNLSFILFNPLSLFINRKISHIKYNPFFQIERKFLKNTKYTLKQ